MVTTTHRTHLLDFSAVAMIDDSAALVLKEQMEKLAARGIHLLFGGVSGDPLSTFARLGMLNRKGRRRICKDLHVAMERALAKVDAPPKWLSRPRYGRSGCSVFLSISTVNKAGVSLPCSPHGHQLHLVVRNAVKRSIQACIGQINHLARCVNIAMGMETARWYSGT